jgi:hypothetical protein
LLTDLYIKGEALLNDFELESDCNEYDKDKDNDYDK